MIHFNKISKSYSSGHYALKDISFKLAKGELAFLTGHSGAGKTTVLNIIAMLESPSSGNALVCNRDIKKISAHQQPFLRRHIGYISQTPNLLWQQSLFDNTALPLVVSGVRSPEIKRRVHAALDDVGLLMKGRMACETLSTGEQQRATIARAIVGRPSVILADEPTGNLDPKLSQEILSLFESLHSLGSTVLVATHDLNLISNLPHRILTLEQGCLLDQKKELA